MDAQAVHRRGRRYLCKPCVNADARAARRKDVEKARAYSRARYARDPAKMNAVSTRVQRVTRWWVWLAICCRTNAKHKKHVPHDIDGDYLLQLFNEQKGRCHWLGIPLVPSINARDPQRPSVDRLQPELGYVRGNVVPSCIFANLGRSQSSVQRTREFLDTLRTHWAAPGTPSE